MSDSPNSTDKTNAQAVRAAIDETLKRGSIAALITIIESETLVVGSKVLITAEPESIGDLGDAALNRSATEEASKFLAARAEATAKRVSEFAPEHQQLANTLLLFERIEAEPQLVVAGAGHVGASLARLGALVGYRVTLIDDRTEFVARNLFAAPAEQNIDLITAESWADAIRVA